MRSVTGSCLMFQSDLEMKLRLTSQTLFMLHSKCSVNLLHYSQKYSYTTNIINCVQFLNSDWLVCKFGSLLTQVNGQSRYQILSFTATGHKTHSTHSTHVLCTQSPHTFWQVLFGLFHCIVLFSIVKSVCEVLPWCSRMSLEVVVAHCMFLLPLTEVVHHMLWDTKQQPHLQVLDLIHDGSNSVKGKSVVWGRDTRSVDMSVRDNQLKRWTWHTYCYHMYNDQINAKFWSLNTAKLNCCLLQHQCTCTLKIVWKVTS